MDGFVQRETRLTTNTQTNLNPMNFLKLIRFQNLALLALMQLIFRYGFLVPQRIPLALTDFQYVLLVLSTVLIAAAGYTINNIFDQETDLINKPQNVIVGKSISENKAYNIYFALNITGVLLGFYLSNTIDKPKFAGIFVLIAAVLYMYATTLKQIAVIGNLIVAVVLAASVLIVGVFDLLPTTNMYNQDIIKSFFNVFIDFAVLAFMLNFLREIIKDIEDYEGDFKEGIQTLPVLIGVSKTAKIAFAVACVPFISLLIYTNNYFANQKLWWTCLYALLFILTPLLFTIVKLWSAKAKEDFSRLSTILKYIVFFGIFGILVLTLNTLL